LPDIITKEFLHQIHPFSDFSARVLMSVLRLNKINRIYNELYPAEDLELIEKIFDYLHITMEYGQEDLDRIPGEGPFITVSNHPFGFIDGFFLILLITKKRMDFKVTVNYLLEPVARPLEKYFIMVNPFDHNKRMGGSHKSMEHLKKGKSLGLFPAGEVSTYYKGQRGIMDRPWGKSSMRLIMKAGVPVIPVFFHGTNSRLFHLLGRIHPFIRTALLPSEFIRKTNFTMKLNTGDHILPEEYASISDPAELAGYLRSRVYALSDSQ
jgi:putative hemolysin